MMITEQIIESVAMKVKQRLAVKIEASGRHIHLSRQDTDLLFGASYEFKIKRELSQPGQYVCMERVDIKGPGGIIKNVAVLGPVRGNTQVEISMTDARILGIDAPVRLSGDIDDTPGCEIMANDKSLAILNGVIVAKRHIHLTPDDAEKFGIKDRDGVKLKVFTERSLVFDDVTARVSKNFSTAVHIDYDEANACGFNKNCTAIILPC